MSQTFIKTYSYLNVEYVAKISQIKSTFLYYIIELNCEKLNIFVTNEFDINSVSTYEKIESNLNQMLIDFNKKIKQIYATDFENLMERLDFKQIDYDRF